MLLMFLNMVLFVYAYLYYKWTRPLMKRPYCVPGGKVGAVCVVVPVIGLTGLTSYFSIVDDEVLFGVPYAKAWGLAAFVG